MNSQSQPSDVPQEESRPKTGTEIGLKIHLPGNKKIHGPKEWAYYLALSLSTSAGTPQEAGPTVRDMAAAILKRYRVCLQYGATPRRAREITEERIRENGIGHYL